MAHANWRLDNPPVVDVAVSRRMGLFVVARLAARHGIRVRLRQASAGGLTALVWLPGEVITSDAAGPSLGLRRQQLSMAGAMARRMGTEAAVGEGDERAAAAREVSAAAQAVSAARIARFEPLRPEADDAATEAGAVLEGTDVLAVPSVNVPAPGPVAGGPGEGLAGRESLSGAVWGASPLAGGQLGSGGPVAGSGQRSGVGALAAPGLIVPPAVSTGEDSRLPIFESVESDWFRRGKRGSGRSVSPPAPDSAGWSSPADEGWRAAEVAHAPVIAGTTVAGLPVRVPKANLVPGGVGGPASPLATGPSPRSAAQARERLASFQRGIREARAAMPGDDGAGSGDAGRAT